MSEARFYEIRDGHIAGHPFNVVRIADGQIVGCHTDRATAEGHTRNCNILAERDALKARRRKARGE